MDKELKAGQVDRMLEIFFSIDKKIMELHQCSSEDFLLLNRSLNENHVKVKLAIDNITNAFVTLGESNNLSSLAALTEHVTRLQEELQGFGTHLDHNLEKLLIVDSNLGLMQVPFHNFRQNLASLKLLLSNVKLTNTSRDRSLQSFSDEEASRIDSIINKVKDSCPVFEENIFNIQKHVKSISLDYTDLKDLVVVQLANQLADLRKEIEILERHNRGVLKNKTKVEKIAGNCKQHVDTIITNLQYHDIIRQKMEQVQETHHIIIRELQKEENNSDKFSELPFLVQIPQVTEIQTAQLLHTNKEYQDAIERITSRMINIASEMNAMAGMCKSMNIFESRGGTFSRETLGVSFRTIVKESEQSLMKFNHLADEISLVQKVVCELIDRFRDLEMIESAIEQRIIDKINFNNMLLSEEKDTATQAQQILKVYADNHFEKNKISTLFKSTKEHLSNCALQNDTYKKEVSGLETIHMHLEAAIGHFEIVEENLAFLDNARSRIVANSKLVDHSHREVVKNVKYYDFFEHTIEELIGKFEKINTMVKDPENPRPDSVTKKRSLEQMEKYYTMKSERMILKQALFNNRKGEGTALYYDISGDAAERKGNDGEFF